MKNFVTILFLSFLSACGVQTINKVGYGKKLDNAVSENCFAIKFNELQKATNYQLSVVVEKAAGKITFYDLTIDGTKTGETPEVFTPKSFKLSKTFMASVIKECSA
jgi:hypothetical protein